MRGLRPWQAWLLAAALLFALMQVAPIVAKFV